MMTAVSRHTDGIILVRGRVRLSLLQLSPQSRVVPMRELFDCYHLALLTIETYKSRCTFRSLYSTRIDPPVLHRVASVVACIVAFWIAIFYNPRARATFNPPSLRCARVPICNPSQSSRSRPLLRPSARCQTKRSIFIERFMFTRLIASQS